MTPRTSIRSEELVYMMGVNEVENPSGRQVSAHNKSYRTSVRKYLTFGFIAQSYYVTSTDDNACVMMYNVETAFSKLE